MSTAAEQLADIEAQMARYAAIHERSLWAWKRLRLKRDTLQEMVASEDAAMDRQAQKYLGPDVRRSS